MTIEELADYIKEKYKLSDEELVRYCEVLLLMLEIAKVTRKVTRDLETI